MFAMYVIALLSLIFIPYALMQKKVQNKFDEKRIEIAANAIVTYNQITSTYCHSSHTVPANCDTSTRQQLEPATVKTNTDVKAQFSSFVLNSSYYTRLISFPAEDIQRNKYMITIFDTKATDNTTLPKGRVVNDILKIIGTSNNAIFVGRYSTGNITPYGGTGSSQIEIRFTQIDSGNITLSNGTLMMVSEY